MATCSVLMMSEGVSTQKVIGLVVAIVATDIVTTHLAPPGSGVYFKIAILAAYVAWARFSASLSWDDMGMSKETVKSGFVVGLLAVVVIGAVIAVLVAIPGTRSYFDNQQIASGSTTNHFLEPLLVIPLGTVVFEETIFRGVLLGSLLKLGSKKQAIVFSSIVFGFWHVSPALSNAHGGFVHSVVAVAGTVAITAVAGVLFALLRLRSGSLVAPILAHIATNSLAYVGALIALQLTS